jgi:hypothetical protein
MWAPALGRNYTIAVFSGDAMGAPVAVQLPDAVAPGASISVDLTALRPQALTRQLETAQCLRRLVRDRADGTAPFWVRIVV